MLSHLSLSVHNSDRNDDPWFFFPILSNTISPNKIMGSDLPFSSFSPSPSFPSSRKSTTYPLFFVVVVPSVIVFPSFFLSSSCLHVSWWWWTHPPTHEFFHQQIVASFLPPPKIPPPPKKFAHFAIILLAACKRKEKELFVSRALLRPPAYSPAYSRASPYSLEDSLRSFVNIHPSINMSFLHAAADYKEKNQHTEEEIRRGTCKRTNNKCKMQTQIPFRSTQCSWFVILILIVNCVICCCPFCELKFAIGNLADYWPKHTKKPNSFFGNSASERDNPSRDRESRSREQEQENSRESICCCCCCWEEEDQEE